jgi:hypothetical protein
MCVTVVANRGSPPAILLRQTYRKAGKVKNRTLANLTKWRPEKIAALRAVLRDDYPGERLILCRNPALAEERARKRGELLDATERALLAIQARVRRKCRPLKGAAAIGEALGAVLGQNRRGRSRERPSGARRCRDLLDED